jgi:hypothetical protein
MWHEGIPAENSEFSKMLDCIIHTSLCTTFFRLICSSDLFMTFILCSLYHLCSQVLLLGDLNYRISLEETETRLLVKAKNWSTLLENDQVFFDELTLDLSTWPTILTMFSFPPGAIAASVWVLDWSTFRRLSRRVSHLLSHLQVPAKLWSVLLVLRGGAGREETCSGMVS